MLGGGAKKVKQWRSVGSLIGTRSGGNPSELIVARFSLGEI
jgi:hypothetical protein